MKKALAILLLLLFAVPSYACWGYRPMGMGGVFVGVADDANLAYWNRAGSALLDDWQDSDKELATSSNFLDSAGFFNRKAWVGNAYYDSVNFAQKINKNFGWSLASTWNGGGSYVLSPGVGFRLPWNMAIGLGYYHWIMETMVDLNNDGTLDRARVQSRQIHLDYLWKVQPEFSFGVHIERFWQIDQVITSPDLAGSITTTGNIADSMNVRPGIAWRPQGKLKGLIVNAGIYDLLANFGGPHYSAGFEYAPPKEPELMSIEEISIKVKGKAVQYKKVVTRNAADNWYNHSAFRAGLYNLGGNGTEYSLLTLGYGYRYSNDLELGYWGGLGISKVGNGTYEHHFGVTWRF